MSEGISPEKLLLDRSSPVMLVQFIRPWGNWPWRPKLLTRKARTLFSPGCQHSTPVNQHMKPLVLLSKIHEDFSMPLGSITDCCTVFRHWTSRREPKHDDEPLNSSNQRTNLVLSAILEMEQNRFLGQKFQLLNSHLSCSKFKHV
jgi:hypothetical protein